jgi:coenzyme F420-reducing hydrogenase beta subunit
MSPRRPKMPSKAEIVEAQRAVWSRLLIDGDPATECWACGATGSLERAHIVAHRNGGSMDPTNFFLLCHICHEEQPDDATVEAQLFWLANHEAQIDRVWRKSMAWGRAIVAGAVTEAQAHAFARQGVEAPVEFRRG